MPNLATWIRQKDAKFFRTIFAKHPDIKVWNARTRNVPLDEMDGLLLSGGSDISPEFLRQDVPDPSVLDKQIDPERDRWEFQAVQNALSRGLPILAICKGLQVFNVALGGTLKLDIPGHNLPHQKESEVQPLRHETAASHRFPKVNSAHHQAIDKLGDDLNVEMGLSFPRGIKTKPGETVLFSYIVFKSRAHRDHVDAKVMKDSRMLRMMKSAPMPFDGKRMMYGGFKSIVEA